MQAHGGLALWGAPEGNQNAKKDKGENKPVNHSIVYGTGNRAYTIARLQRDNPELHERVVSGELSANAAAIQAGFCSDLFLALLCVFAKYFFDVFFVREALSEDFEDSEQQLDNCIHRMRLPKVND